MYKHVTRYLLPCLFIALLPACTTTASNFLTTEQCINGDSGSISFVINADDVGMHKDMDKAVFELYELGKIQTFSLMVPANNFDEAAMYALKNNVPVGLHLTLTNEWQAANGWSPILDRKIVPSLYNKQGYMWATGQEIADNVKTEEAQLEIEAQIDRALALGLEVTHLDFHMVYWAVRDDLYTMTLNVAIKYNLPIIMQMYWATQDEQITKVSALKAKGLIAPDIFWMYYNPTKRAQNQYLSKMLYHKMFKNAQPALHHVAIHPSYLTPSAKLGMLDAPFRYDDYKIWLSDKLNQIIIDKGITLTNHRKLKQLADKNINCKIPTNAK